MTRPPQLQAREKALQGQRHPHGKQRIANALIEDLTNEWLEHGPACLRVMRARDVTKFVQLCYSILPRDVLIAVEHRTLPGNLDPEDWHLMKQIIDTIKAAIPPGTNSPPSEIFGVIEEALRAHFAKRLEGAA